MSDTLNQIAILFTTFVLCLLADEVRAENIDSQRFVQIIACESSWRQSSVGDGGQSFDLPQFKRETFRWMSRRAMRDPEFVSAFRVVERRISRPIFRYPAHKLMVAQWGMSNGFGNHWACYRKLKGKQ